MTFTLALLGTDTQYQTALTPSEYPRGETLSIMASLLQHHGPLPPCENDEVEHLCSQNFHLIDGPLTLGKEVYNRIKRGFFASLRAIVAGKTQINVFAHSRGAAEAILLAHELQRLQTLGAAMTLDKLAESQVPKLKTELQSLSWTEDQLISLKQHLPLLKLSMFLLDPVPGDGYLGLGWYEEGFKSLPPIVKHCEEYVYANERTRFFYPIIPKPHEEAGSHYKLRILPGHHGTGSGNPYDQTKGWSSTPPTTFNREHTEGLQDLVAMKLAYFLIKQGAKFRLSSALPPYASEVIAILQLWQTRVQVMQLNPELSFYEESERIYRFLVDSNAHQTFSLFDNTSYPYLGRPCGDSRFIYYHDNLIFLNQQFLQLRDSSSAFFNPDHLEIYVNSVLSLSGDEDPLAYLNKLIQYFRTKILSDPSLQSLSGSKTLLIQALAEAIRNPYINGYYQTQEKLNDLVVKVKELIQVFRQDPDQNNPRKEFYDGLNREVEVTLTQRQENLRVHFEKLKTRHWQFPHYQGFDPKLMEAYQKLSLPSDSPFREKILGFYAELMHEFRDSNVLKLDADAIIQRFKAEIVDDSDELYRNLFTVIAECVSSFNALNPDEEKTKHYKTVLGYMAQDLVDMQAVIQMSQAFEISPIPYSDIFDASLESMAHYIESQQLDLFLVYDTLPERSHIFSLLMSNSRFQDLCVRNFRKALFEVNLGEDELHNLNRQYQFLWSCEYENSQLNELKHCFTLMEYQNRAQKIFDEANNQAHHLGGLSHVVQARKQLNDLKREIAENSSSEDLQMIQELDRLIQRLDENYSKLTHDFSTWLETLNRELLHYQIQTKTLKKQEILEELQAILSQESHPLLKICAFFEGVGRHQTELCLHRSPLWLQISKDIAVLLPSLVALGSVVSAAIFVGPVLACIIAGLSLISLALEAAVIQQRRGDLCFWRPQGMAFVQRIGQLEEKLNSTLSA